jgi:diadenylate cyclase
MDGALVLDETASRILWANVHLMPDPAIPTVETGTRHRTAERVARQAGVPVVSVSHSDAHHHPLRRGLAPRLEDGRLGAVAGQPGGGHPGHYRARFDEASAALDAASCTARRPCATS